MPRKVLVAVPDLLLQSRILDAAKRAGIAASVAGTPDEVLALAAQERPGLIVFDLESPRVHAASALARLRAEAALEAIPTIGFFSHVHPDLAQRMLQQGLGKALPRGQFVQQLDALLGAIAD